MQSEQIKIDRDMTKCQMLTKANKKEFSVVKAGTI